MKINPHIFFRTALLVSSFLFSLAASAEWVTGITPTNIAYDGQYSIVYFVPAAGPTVGGCSATDFYAINSTTDPKTLLSVLMAAKAMGKTVAIYVPTDSSRCHAMSGRPALTGVRIEG